MLHLLLRRCCSMFAQSSIAPRHRLRLNDASTVPTESSQRVPLNYCQISLIINVISRARSGEKILFRTQAHGGFYDMLKMLRGLVADAEERDRSSAVPCSGVTSRNLPSLSRVSHRKVLTLPAHLTKNTSHAAHATFALLGLLTSQMFPYR